MNGLKKIAKTRWLGRVSMLKRVMNESSILVQKMHNGNEDSTTTHQSHEVAKGNLSH